MTSGKSTVIPRPVTKRQFSSPASCGIAHINLSDVVAKINSGGPKSCTNPFRNGLLSLSSADDNLNRIDFNETLNPYSGERYLYAQVIDEKSPIKNPFRRQQHEPTSNDRPFFLFPSNGNINDTTSTSKASYDSGEYIETTAMLIELNEDEEQEAEEQGTVGDSKDDGDDDDDNCNETNEEEIKLLQIVTNTNDSSTFSSQTVNVPANSSIVHNRSLSDTGSTLPNTRNNLEQLKTMNPFNAASQNLHKTVSDTYLEKYSIQNSSSSSPPQQQHSPSHSSFHRTSSRQSIDNNSLSNDPANNPSTPLNANESELKRAMSCESVNSESSVLLADLEPPQTVVYPSVTGQLCVGLQYDK